MTSVLKVDTQDGSAAGHALVVVGMHRSGTSAMARTLSLLGAALPTNLMKPQHDNAEGFWESDKVADFNDEILATLDSEWDDVFSFRPRPYLSNFDRVFVGRAVELLQQEFRQAELIVFKDPRLSVLTAFWERALRQAGYSTSYVIMVRNPLEVAESLRSRNSFPRDKSLLLWSSYMTAVERDTRGLSRTFVAYDDLMSDWRQVLTRVEQAAGMPFPRDTPAARNEIDSFLRRNLRHHEADNEDLSARGDVPDYVKTLYRVFEAACRGESIDEQSIDAVSAELTRIESSVGGLVADLRARARSLDKDLAEVREAEQQASTELAEQQRQTAELRTALEQEQAAASEVRNALVEALHEKSQTEGLLNEARSRLAALAEELQQKDAAIAEARSNTALHERLAAELNKRVASLQEDVRQVKEAAQEEKRALDARLGERFGEIASLTKLLAETEERERQARADADWLRQAGSVLLSGSSRRKGGFLRGLLPASVQAKRQRQALKEMGLFDEHAYLSSNPDVAEQGADPLGHYVTHGMAEERRRD